MSTTAPILFIGTQRSGTTWMGDLLSQHPALAYWPEPRHVWMWSNAYRADDRLTAADATPRIVKHIRGVFDGFVRERGRERLVEKTPSNCLRIPFLRAVYPDAKIILIIRDGRSVIRSTDEILGQGVPTTRMVQRALETPLWEWPAYAGRAATTIGRKVTRRPLNFWGPRPPGWREWVKSDPTEIVLAKQWSATITTAVEDGAKDDPSNFMQFRYDELMARPREMMQRLLDFAGLTPAGLLDAAERTADPARQEKWKQELDGPTLELIRPHMEPTLTKLGYEW